MKVYMVFLNSVFKLWKCPGQVTSLNQKVVVWSAERLEYSVKIDEIGAKVGSCWGSEMGSSREKKICKLKRIQTVDYLLILFYFL